MPENDTPEEMPTGPEFRPTDTSNFSWRDHIRELMTLKYGRKGKFLAESLIGEPEEEKYMSYLERTYGHRLPKDEDIPSSRPLSDMAAVGRGGGVSDWGLVDTALMGISGAGIPRVSTAAAATESGVLGADAYGEYQKGNPLAASIMGAAAGVPPLLRYMNPPPGVTKAPPKQLDLYDQYIEELPDPGRREATKKIAQGVGGLAVLASTPALLRRATKAATDAPIVKNLPPGVAKMTPAIRGVDISGTQLLNLNSEILAKADKILEGIFKGKWADDYDYELTSSVYKLTKIKDYEKLSYPEIKNILVKDAERIAKGYPSEYQDEVLEVFSSDEYVKVIMNSLEEGKAIYRDNPELAKLLKEAEAADQAVMKGGGHSNIDRTPKQIDLMDKYHNKEALVSDYLDKLGIDTTYQIYPKALTFD
jgi:hypothetical protein